MKKINIKRKENLGWKIMSQKSINKIVGNKKDDKVWNKEDNNKLKLAIKEDTEWGLSKK